MVSKDTHVISTTLCILSHAVCDSFAAQACRGTDLDPGVEVSDAAPDQEEEAMEDEVVMRRIPAEADFLMAYSVVPGQLGY